MARISNRKRITPSEDFATHTDLGPPRLDIYIGYTEQILNLCAKIVELPFLQHDTISLRLAVASMYVSFRQSNSHSLTVPETTPSSPGLTQTPIISFPKDSPTKV